MLQLRAQMNFKSLKVIPHTQEKVWLTMRDHLHEISDLMDDVKSIEEVEREQIIEGKVKVVSIWKSAPRLPRVLVRSLKPGMLAWTDTAIWTDARQSCSWTIDSHYFKEKMQCQGTISFESAMKGEGCRILFQGSINFSKENLFSAGPFDRLASKTLETVLGKLIPGNFQKMATGIKGLIEQQNG